MKYQQLDNLESGWKWQYLIRKHHEGVVITRHLDQQASEEAVNLLLQLEHHPTQVVQWIELHMSLDLDKQLKQSIRARRKRHFNAEALHTRKKSVDLEYGVWQQLVAYAREQQLTLSAAISHLIHAAADREQYKQQMDAVRGDLLQLLAADQGINVDHQSSLQVDI